MAKISIASIRRLLHLAVTLLLLINPKKNNHTCAWAHGHFKDDAAWDFMDEIEEAQLMP